MFRQSTVANVTLSKAVLSANKLFLLLKYYLLLRPILSINGNLKDKEIEKKVLFALHIMSIICHVYNCLPNPCSI